MTWRERSGEWIAVKLTGKSRADLEEENFTLHAQLAEADAEIVRLNADLFHAQLLLRLLEPLE